MKTKKATTASSKVTSKSTTQTRHDLERNGFPDQQNMLICTLLAKDTNG
jgi:hypothetical protein